MKEFTDEWGFTERLYSEEPKFEAAYNSSVEALKESLEILNSEDWKTKLGWKLEAEDSTTGDRVYSKQVTKKGKTFISVAEFDVDAQTLFQDAFHDISKVPSWNPTIIDYKKILDIGTQTVIVYTQSHDILGGLVKSRDFVDARCWRKIGDDFYVAGQAFDLPDVPPQPKSVRGENFPGAILMRDLKDKPGHAETYWLRSNDLKGMLPKALVDRAMKYMMMEYTKHSRKHFQEMKKDQGETC